MTEIKREADEPLLSFAHRKAIEIAGKTSDPILDPWRFSNIYWTVMGGYGFRPYCPGRPSHW